MLNGGVDHANQVEKFIEIDGLRKGPLLNPSKVKRDFWFNSGLDPEWVLN